ncbi:DUF4351 domain-containing protein [Billgrantia montanilacus]|nr:DUF4351 domain-containing protein [Halomonas montanilacus]
MPCVTSAERFGIEKGRQEGELLLLARQITLKFGELANWA